MSVDGYVLLGGLGEGRADTVPKPHGRVLDRPAALKELPARGAVPGALLRIVELAESARR